MFIRSERLFLRPGWPEDWEELLHRIADQGIVHNLARAPWPYRAEHARDFAGRAQDKRFPHFLVTLPGATGPRLVGSCGLASVDGSGGGDAELGYWIGRDYWGQGFATEVARALLRLAHTLGHRRIEAGHFVDNPASGKVLRKVGFRPTGDITRRHSKGRGVAVDSVSYAIDLGETGNCDGDSPAPCRRDAPLPAMRAA
jgi:RimJ/RimL family protein N-acetyltransferase